MNGHFMSEKQKLAAYMQGQRVAMVGDAGKHGQIFDDDDMEREDGSIDDEDSEEEISLEEGDDGEGLDDHEEQESSSGEDMLASDPDNNPEAMLEEADPISSHEDSAKALNDNFEGKEEESSDPEPIADTKENGSAENKTLPVAPEPAIE